MLDQILNQSPIAWILSKATYEKPYPNASYAEYTFSGNLPNRMTSQIWKLMEPYYRSDSTFTLSERANGAERSLMIRFGNKRSSKDRVTFCYTIEETE
jgi:hypothetical protein